MSSSSVEFGTTFFARADFQVEAKKQDRYATDIYSGVSETSSLTGRLLGIVTHGQKKWRNRVIGLEMLLVKRLHDIEKAVLETSRSQSNNGGGGLAGIFGQGLYDMLDSIRELRKKWMGKSGVVPEEMIERSPKKGSVFSRIRSGVNKRLGGVAKAAKRLGSVVEAPLAKKVLGAIPKGLLSKGLGHIIPMMGAYDLFQTVNDMPKMINNPNVGPSMSEQFNDWGEKNLPSFMTSKGHEQFANWTSDIGKSVESVFTKALDSTWKEVKAWGQNVSDKTQGFAQDAALKLRKSGKDISDSTLDIKDKLVGAVQSGFTWVTDNFEAIKMKMASALELMLDPTSLQDLSTWLKESLHRLAGKMLGALGLGGKPGTNTPGSTGGATTPSQSGSWWSGNGTQTAKQGSWWSGGTNSSTPGATSGSYPIPADEKALADHIKQIAPNLTNEQCVELAKKSVGAEGSVSSWRRGDDVMSGNMKIGTPIATFMDRRGKQSDKYDGGEGVGAPGNNTTHAAVFAGYQRDENGGITGIKVWEQYKGSGGPYTHVYAVGDKRGGEKSAENYAAIKDEQGNYLGGKNNPMTPREEGKGGASGGAGASSPFDTKSSFSADDIKDISSEGNPAWSRFGQMDKPEGLIFHHTGSRGGPESVMDTFKQRNFPAQFIMDRDGQVYRALPDGMRGQHIRPSEINGLNNSNALGVEVIANDDKDITPQQVEASKKFSTWASKNYGFSMDNVFGHGEINHHKQATEGHTIVDAIRHDQGLSSEPKVGQPSFIPKEDRTLSTFMGRDPSVRAIVSPKVDTAPAMEDAPAMLDKPSSSATPATTPSGTGSSGSVTTAPTNSDSSGSSGSAPSNKDSAMIYRDGSGMRIFNPSEFS